MMWHRASSPRSSHRASRRWISSLLLAGTATLAACKGDSPPAADEPVAKGSGAGAGSPGDKASEKAGEKAGEKKARPPVEPIKPSIDIETPPADAVKLPSGMIFKKLSTTDGPMPTRNDTVLIHFTGWKTETGETFNTTRTRGNPMPLDLSTAGPGFGEVFVQLHKGEKAMMWMPVELVSKNGQGKAEALAFEAELVDIQPAPLVPPDAAGPPATAKRTKGGLRYVVVTPGTGAVKPQSYDTATFRYTIWDATGKMLSSTEKRSRPVSSVLYRQPAALEDVLMTMVAGQRTRFWVDAARMEHVSLEHTQGQLCYELQLIEVTKSEQVPPPVPRDVAAPPAGAKKTASGLAYRVLKPGKGTAKPAATDTVKVNYSGWTTDGRMFDSSTTRGEATSFPLNGVIPGWTEGMQLMTVGETARFWIPEALAYKGVPNQPKGMLVFDVELVEILAPGAGGHPPGGAPHGGAHGAPSPHAADDGHGH